MVDQSCKPWLDHPVGRPSPIFAWHHPCVSLRLRKSQSLPAEDGANQRIKEALHFNFNATSQLRPKLVFLPWADVHGTCTGRSRSQLAYLAMPATNSILVPSTHHVGAIGGCRWATVAESVPWKVCSSLFNNVIQVCHMVIQLRMIFLTPEVTNFNTCNMWVYDGLRLQSRGCMWRPLFFTNCGASAPGPRFHGPTDLAWIFLNSLTMLDWYCISFILYIKAQDHLISFVALPLVSHDVPAASGWWRPHMIHTRGMRSAARSRVWEMLNANPQIPKFPSLSSRHIESLNIIEQ